MILWQVLVLQSALGIQLGRIAEPIITPVESADR
jgi:hypothetical protein